MAGPRRRRSAPGSRPRPGAGGAARREIVANAIAEASDPRFVEDVRSRRLAIARGRGTVHGAAYLLEDWGLAEVEAGLTGLG